MPQAAANAWGIGSCVSGNRLGQSSKDAACLLQVKPTDSCFRVTSQMLSSGPSPEKEPSGS
ncbi:Uncharacterised protein [Mycobacteroides abscessus subsp. abscessus]|nr:Uncharacterised protein [Mycobacteroides abscessus subsp. abscessus]